MIKRARILVADDDLLYRTLFAACLEDAGYEVRSVSNGAEALAAVDAGPFDLLLLDLFMPVLDGLSTLKQLQARGVLSRLPVIVITASDEPESLGRCLEAGALDFLPKPFEPALLITRAGAALALQQNVRLVQKLQDVAALLSPLLQEGSLSLEQRAALESAIQILST